MEALPVLPVSPDLPRAPVLSTFLTDDWVEIDPRPLTDAQVRRGQAAAPARRRRERLAELFPGEVLVIPAGSYARRSNDTDFRFRPHSAHVWLSGNQAPDSVLVLSDGEPELFIRPRKGPSTDEFWSDRRYGEFWSGPRPSLTEASAQFGIPVRSLDDLAGALRGAPRVLRGVDASVDRLVGTGAGESADTELDVALARLRIVKDSWELEQLQTAVDVTVQGFADCIGEWNAVLEHGERWIEGTFGRRARVGGNDVGYSSIAAAGAHATTLHWIDNDGAVRPGDLVLMDMGVEIDTLYTADITRTVPASGTWTPLQRDVYSIVLAAQDAGIAQVRPGVPFREFHRECVRVLVEGLADLGLLPCSAAEAMDPASTVYGRWVLCGSGHMLGLDVHDCRGGGADQSLDGLLEPGNVLTVEPGLYFQPGDLKVPEELRGVGIRIEDDLVVTESGNRNLSAALPRSVAAVEEWMSAGQLPACS